MSIIESIMRVLDVCYVSILFGCQIFTHPPGASKQKMESSQIMEKEIDHNSSGGNCLPALF